MIHNFRMVMGVGPLDPTLVSLRFDFGRDGNRRYSHSDDIFSEYN